MSLFGPQIYSLEAANMFVGGGPSQHLRLVDVHLPSMEEEYVDHRPGGAPVGIEVDVIVNRLQCDFTLAGWTPQVAALINAWYGVQNGFEFYGALRDQNGGTVHRVAARMFGRLGKATQNDWRRGTLSTWSYSIRGIIQYRLTVDDSNVVYDWSFFENEFSTAS